jgi:hypothetical protein
MTSSQAEIDWAEAEVVDGRLVVGLAGEPSAAWVKRAKAVLERLERPGSGWGSVKVTTKKIEVDGLAEGQENALRHFVDSIVQQANADLAEDEDEQDDDEGGAVSESDARMTEAFRAFAPQDESESD